MSVKRSRPGKHAVKRGKEVGPDYPDNRFTNPMNAGIDEEYGSTTAKALDSPTATTVGGADVPIHKNTYDDLWEE